jgi:hypothetical protein
VQMTRGGGGDAAHLSTHFPGAVRPIIHAHKVLDAAAVLREIRCSAPKPKPEMDA